MAKPFAVLLLLLGMWGAELALFGLWWAGALAAVMWLGCAAVLVREREPRAQVSATAKGTRSRRAAHVMG